MTRWQQHVKLKPFVTDAPIVINDALGCWCASIECSGVMLGTTLSNQLPMSWRSVLASNRRQQTHAPRWRIPPMSWRVIREAAREYDDYNVLVDNLIAGMLNSFWKVTGFESWNMWQPRWRTILSLPRWYQCATYEELQRTLLALKRFDCQLNAPRSLLCVSRRASAFCWYD